ncbi:MAG TPA: vitamin K epoxide reductase family protein [Candidatus Acidoferrum sp.]|nr:vitamin K epoxide reductase family protein [Candidatus Acidoferrum sp.]
MKKLYAVMIAGGLIGMTAAFLQTLEKLTLLQNPHASLYCSINAVFSCTNVLNAWQASVFGFPNSIMCLTLFTIFSAIALAGLSGAGLGKRLRLGVQVLSLLTLGFAIWFLAQSIYVIGAICVFCLVCFAGLLMVNFAWLRLNANDLPLGRRTMQAAIVRNYDTLAWVALAVVLAIAITLRFM